ncbi:MAG TPA: hypothetical protein VGY48_15880 [Vicinamibacterales bacterium]|jgi:hypothetical protein|nr:hypothetical protein [Vicinamibacterales bacterium]
MANRKSTNGHSKRKHTPFMDRFSKRIMKTKEWATKTAARFAGAPNRDVADSLGAISDSLDAIVEALPKLKDWTPPARGPSFGVGDSVSFKPEKIAELIEAGFFKKGTLEGEHEIEAINGRKVKLACGIFQSRELRKSAEA